MSPLPGWLGRLGFVTVDDAPAVDEPPAATSPSSKATSTTSTPGPAPEASPSAEPLAKASTVGAGRPRRSLAGPSQSGTASPPAPGAAP